LTLAIGNYIRSNFKLWHSNHELFWACSKDACKAAKHPDEASAIIIARLALELEKTRKHGYKEIEKSSHQSSESLNEVFGGIFWAVGG
jgi:hypothetical protein